MTNLRVAARLYLPEPRDIQDTGLSSGFLSDLVLKVLYARGNLTGYEIADELKLPFPNIVDRLLDALRREHLVEIKGSNGGGVAESAYQFAVSDAGRTRARELIRDNGYIGPAPVQLDAYVNAVLVQSVSGQTISPERMRTALKHLVLDEHLLAQIGPAVNSARSIFIFGSPGNGKTAIAESIGHMLPGSIHVPYAIHAEGQIIKLYDAMNHHPAREGEEREAAAKRGQRFDRRWVQIERPLLATGGELMLESLDLTFDPTGKFYEAPYQMKANGGVFLIDDFGRQQVRPRDLLNRWIMPLEKRVDYLTLANGRKIQVPFDALIVFSTNLNPAELVDEAFLRRIRYKIFVPDPTWDDYREIFARICRCRGVEYSDEALRYLITEYYVKPKRKPRAVHPRDLVDELVDIARFAGVEPILSQQLVDQACNTYFLRI